MATTINGKVYTSHPLMDEIVYNCKIILKNIVVKNDVLANDYEDESFLSRVEAYMMVKVGNAVFASFPFEEDMLKAYGYSISEINAILINRNNVPVEERDDLLQFCCNWLLENYEEENNYYRSLYGLPPYGTDEYNIYIDESYFPSNYKKELDFSKPIHEFDNVSINVLKINGKIELLKEKYKGFNYSYINHLGDLKIDPYKARTAGKYDILYIPKTESAINDRFNELYNYNKDIYLKRTYSEAYSYGSEYYEQYIIISIIAQTFNDMIVDTPEWYIRRDIFDLRSVQYFLESYGVEYFKEIPLKYQIRIVKNLNKLIKYKSSNKNFDDILEIFDLKGTSIYKYYLYKKRKTDVNGKYVNIGANKDKYELEFVQSKINESYDDYIKDLSYHSSYDSITKEDKYWDGEDNHEYVKNLHLSRDFTIEPTKYISLEYKTSISEYLFQMEYFMGLVLDSKINISSIQVAIPSIETGINFELDNLFLFLCLLTFGYNNLNTTIRRPNIIDGDSITNEISGLDKDYLYDWMKHSMSEMFTEENDRVIGFNSSVNIEEIKEVISNRHSAYQFDNGYTLEDFGVEKFNVPNEITSFEELTDTYFNNKECYDNLCKIITEEIDNNDKYRTAVYIFKQLFTKQFDYDSYKVEGNDVTRLEETLQEKNYILYEKYNKIMSETNMEARQDNIRAMMNDIVNTLEYYLSDEGLDYVFSFTTVSSFQSLLRYIYLMINFFKSYKSYFLDPYITYKMDNKVENNATAYDTIKEKKLIYHDRRDKLFSRDNVRIIGQYLVNSSLKDNMLELLDISTYFDPDPEDDYDYDGLYPDTDESFKDADGGGVEEGIPYIMLNGGDPQLGMIVWDLNGSDPNDVENSLELNGGYVDDLEEYRTDYWRTAYKYIVDGGAPSTNQFISKSTILRIIDNQISIDARISTIAGNKLVIMDDGLYLKQIWVDQKTFDEFEEEYKVTLDEFTATYNKLLKTIIIAGDEEALDKFIVESVDDVLKYMRKYVSYMKDDAFENSLNEYVDQGVDLLYENFEDFSPYKWEKF